MDDFYRKKNNNHQNMVLITKALTCGDSKEYYDVGG